MKCRRFVFSVLAGVPSSGRGIRRVDPRPFFPVRLALCIGLLCMAFFLTACASWRSPVAPKAGTGDGALISGKQRPASAQITAPDREYPDMPPASHARHGGAGITAAPSLASSPALRDKSGAAPLREQAASSHGPAVPPVPRSPYQLHWSPPAEKEPAVRAAAPVADDGGIVFHFDDADIYEVIRTMADMLGIHYMIDPAVSGKVTLQTSGKLDRADLFSVFHQVLEANGLAAVRKGLIYRIVPAKDALRLPLRAGTGSVGNVPPGERIIMQLIPLSHIAADEMTKIITPFVSDDGAILTHADTNTLLVVDQAENIRKALRLVSAFDVNVFRNMAHRLYALRHSSVEEILPLLKTVLSAQGNTGRMRTQILSLKRLNQLMVMSADPSVFVQVESLLRQLDIPSDATDPRIYVYSVRNGEAEDLAAILNQVFERGASEEEAEKKGDADEAAAAAGDRPAAPADPFDGSTNAGLETSGTSPPGGEGAPAAGAAPASSGKTLVRIIPDVVRNALIIEAVPGIYDVISGILRQIDVLPRQVLIEATIAEITLDDSTELGVEWNFTKSGKSETGLLSAKISGDGLAYTIGLTDKWTTALSALANKNQVNILSAPVILASDNKDAKINVSTKVPVVTTEYQYESDTQPIFQTTVQYRDTGIILTVTPHINQRGLVSMDISQEISEQAGGVEAGGQEYPSFYERSINTSLTVKDGQTIVIGGLMKETWDEGNTGIPFLKDIPVLGYLFGKTSSTVNKTELIVMITPRVITALDEIDELTREFQDKVSRMRQTPPVQVPPLRFPEGDFPGHAASVQ
ncbi:MAG: type II secretion system protein GspD [Desulfobacterales bacterium]|nr:MAG: type II secretion system protein GspD [Desulfobacterales bacterium]